MAKERANEYTLPALPPPFPWRCLQEGEKAGATQPAAVGYIMYRTTGPNPDNLFDLGQDNPPNIRQGKGKLKWGQGRREAPVGEGRVRGRRGINAKMQQRQLRHGGSSAAPVCI